MARNHKRKANKAASPPFMKLFGTDPVDPLGNKRPMQEIRDKIYSYAFSRDRRDSSKQDWVVTQWGFNRNVPERYIPDTPYATAAYQRLDELPCNLHLVNKTISSDFLRHIYTQNSLEVDIDLKAVFTEQAAAGFDKILQLLRNPNFKMYTRIARVRIHFPGTYPMNKLPDFNFAVLDQVAAFIDNFEQLHHMQIRVVLSQGPPLDYELRVVTFPFYPNKMTNWTVRVLSTQIHNTWDLLGPQQVQVLDKAFNIYTDTDNIMAPVSQDPSQQRLVRNKARLSNMAQPVGGNDADNKQYTAKNGTQKVQSYKTVRPESSSTVNSKSELQSSMTSNEIAGIEEVNTSHQDQFVGNGPRPKVTGMGNDNGSGQGGAHTVHHHNLVSHLPASPNPAGARNQLPPAAAQKSASGPNGGDSNYNPAASVVETPALKDDNVLAQETQKNTETSASPVTSLHGQSCNMSSTDMHTSVNTASKTMKKRSKSAKKYKKPKKVRATADQLEELADKSSDELMDSMTNPGEILEGTTLAQHEAKQQSAQASDEDAEAEGLVINTKPQRLLIRNTADITRALRLRERRSDREARQQAVAKRTRELRQSRKAKEAVLRRNNLDAGSRLLLAFQPRRDNDKKKQIDDDNDKKLITDTTKNDTEAAEDFRQTGDCVLRLNMLHAFMQENYGHHFNFFVDDDDDHANDRQSALDYQHPEAQEIVSDDEGYRECYEVKEDGIDQSSEDLTPRSPTGSPGSNESLPRLYPRFSAAEEAEDLHDGNDTSSTLRDETEGPSDENPDAGVVNPRANSVVESADIGFAPGYGSPDLSHHQATSRDTGNDCQPHDDEKEHINLRNRGSRQDHGGRRRYSQGGRQISHQDWRGRPDMGTQQENQPARGSWRGGSQRPNQKHRQDNRARRGASGRYGFPPRSQMPRDREGGPLSEMRNRWATTVLDGDDALRASRQQKQLELEKEMKEAGQEYSSYSSRITDNWTKTDEDGASVAEKNEQMVYNGQS